MRQSRRYKSKAEKPTVFAWSYSSQPNFTMLQSDLVGPMRNVWQQSNSVRQSYKMVVFKAIIHEYLEYLCWARLNKIK